MEENQNLEVKNETSNSNKTSQPTENKKKRSFLDINLSWVVLILIVGLIALFAYLNNTFIYTNNGISVSGSSNNTGVSIGLNVASCAIGVILSFVFYNLSKIIGAKLGGYTIQSIEVFGLTWTRINEKYVFSFKLAQILDFHLTFKANDIEKSKPAMLFFFGHILNVVLVAVLAVAGYFMGHASETANSLTAFGGVVLGSTLYALLIPIYEILPIKSDSDPDMYAFIRTLGKDNKKAFNLLTVEKAKMQSNEDFIDPDFEDYDSYYKARTLIYKYLNHLYREESDKAIAVLKQALYFSNYLSLDEQYFINGEKIFIYLLTGNEKAANKNYYLLKRENRKELSLPNYLPQFRTALIVSGIIMNDEEIVLDIVDNFNNFDLTKKVFSNVVEHKLFTKAYEKVKAAHPEYPLPPVRGLDTAPIEKDDSDSHNDGDTETQKLDLD